MVNFKSILSLLAPAAFTLTLTSAAEPIYVKDCSYNKTDTNSANTNFATCSTEICMNEIIIFDGCSCIGDTIFRLYNENLVEVAIGDDSCGFCSKIQHQLTTDGPCRSISIRMGCWSTSSCSATVSVFKEILATPNPSISPAPSTFVFSDSPSTNPTQFAFFPDAPSFAPTVDFDPNGAVPSSAPAFDSSITDVPSFAPSVASSTSPHHSSPIINLNFDGGATALNIVVAPGDTVTYTATYSPFYITSMYFTASNAYSHSYTYYAEFTYAFYITDSIYRSGDGIVAVRTPVSFTSWSNRAFVNVGQFIRWPLNELEVPTYPTYFYGIDSNPGISRSGSDYYDYTFVIPGNYSWYSSSWVFWEVIVNDPISTPHRNIKWGTNQITYSESISPNTHLVFYASDGYKHNIRIINSRSNELVWLSNDLSLPGDSAIVNLPPGYYYATCDYHPSMSMSIYVASDPPHNGDDDWNKKSIIPKSFIHAAELSLFMAGVLGLSDFILRTLRDEHPKIPKSPIGYDGNHISFHALDDSNANQRNSQTTN